MAELAEQFDIPPNQIQDWKRKLVATVYPKPRTSQPGAGHKVYPYLLKGLTIDRPNQVWASDICSVPMAKGFMYLTVIMAGKSPDALLAPGDLYL